MNRRFQCRLGLLDSRAYGSPQNRLRLFVLAASRGVQLPPLPEPTHSNPLPQVVKFRLEDGQPEVAFYVGRGTPGSGPLPAVTVLDALSDLPGELTSLSASPDGRHTTDTESRVPLPTVGDGDDRYLTLLTSTKNSGRIRECFQKIDCLASCQAEVRQEKTLGLDFLIQLNTPRIRRTIINYQCVVGWRERQSVIITRRTRDLARWKCTSASLDSVKAI